MLLTLVALDHRFKKIGRNNLLKKNMNEAKCHGLYISNNVYVSSILGICVMKLLLLLKKIFSAVSFNHLHAFIFFRLRFLYLFILSFFLWENCPWLWANYLGLMAVSFLIHQHRQMMLNHYKLYKEQTNCNRYALMISLTMQQIIWGY